jgi:DNA-binding NarL/FixJ family response regulator
VSATSRAESKDLIRVIVVEDEPLFRDLLVSAIISRIPVVTVVGKFSTAEECLAEVGSLKADVLLTDIDLGSGATGVNLAIELRERSVVRGVVLLSNLALPNVIPAVPESVAGGWAYLLKTSASNINQVGRAILAADRGEILLDEALIGSMAPNEPSPLDALTPRQLEVLALMASGRSNRAIGEIIGLTPRSVESVASQIIENLGLRDGAEGLNPRVSCILLYLEHVVPARTKASLPIADR